MFLITHWFRAFVWTLAIEELAAAWVLRRHVSLPRRVAIIAVCNIATHPAVWLVYPELGAALHWSHLTTLFVSEVWAFGLEALIYWLFLGKQHGLLAAWTSTFANGLSLGLGFGLRALGWV